jgi:hypothetical protein
MKPLSIISERTAKKDGCGKITDMGKSFISDHMGRIV